MLQKITTNLWFDTEAETAARFYTSIFPNSEMGTIMRYGKAGHEVHGMPEGTVMTVDFSLEGHGFIALNGGPHFKFNEAVSFIIHCDSQEEVDYYWAKLGEGGDSAAQQCGWLKDRFGLSWQVVPIAIYKYLNHSNNEIAANAMSAMLQMKKLDMPALQRAIERIV